jgi:hypothetical protein
MDSLFSWLGTEAHKRGRRCQRSTERPVGVQNSWRYAGPCIAEAAALAPVRRVIFYPS